MTPETVAGLVRRWVRLYTRGLPAPVAERRVEEVAADVHEQIAQARADGVGESRAALAIASRAVRGVVADAAWRDDVLTRHPWTSAEARTRSTTAYRRAIAAALGAVLVLVWLIGAVGIIGTEGDSADRMYGAVLAIGAIGCVVARFRAAGMARVLVAMAVAQASVAVIALAAGLVPAYNSPFEIVVLNGFFVVLFVGSAWSFRRAGRHRPVNPRGPAPSSGSRT